MVTIIELKYTGKFGEFGKFKQHSLKFYHNFSVNSRYPQCCLKQGLQDNCHVLHTIKGFAKLFANEFFANEITG